MKITLEWLESKNACGDGKKWFKKCGEVDHEKIIEKLIKEDRFNWSNWLITKMFSKKDCIKYAVFAAEQVLDIFEKKFPDDKRPRLAIEAAKACIDNNTSKNRKTAYAAAAAAYAAAYDAADAAAYAAAYDAADAAKKSNQLATANICREVLTQEVFNKYVKL